MVAGDQLPKLKLKRLVSSETGFFFDQSVVWKVNSRDVAGSGTLSFVLSPKSHILNSGIRFQPEKNMTIAMRARIQKLICLLILGLSACAYMTTEKPASPETVESIAETMQAHQADFKACFDARTEAQSGPVTGQVLVEWTVNPRGKALDPHVVNSTLKLPGVEACLIKKVSQIRFASAEKEVPVQYPFAFNKL
jgi:hypothetical protein